MPGAGAAAAAGGGGGISGAVGAMGGPVQVAFAALAAMKAFKDGLASSIKGVGDFGAAMISPSNDPADMVNSMGGAVKGFSDKLFYVSPILGIFGAALGQSVMVIGTFMKALDGMVNRYETFNVTLAMAQARAETVQLLGDLRRAQTAGPQLAQYVMLRSEMQQKFEDAKIRMLTRILPLVMVGMKFAETLLPIAEIIVELLTKMGEAVPGIGDEIRRIRAAL